MTQSSRIMSCEEFQSQLPDLIGSGENVANHEHIRNCQLCRALLADLETIAEAARMLIPPVEEPPDKLWDKIENAIKSENGAVTLSKNGTKSHAEHGLTSPKN